MCHSSTLNDHKPTFEIDRLSSRKIFWPPRHYKRQITFSYWVTSIFPPRNVMQGKFPRLTISNPPGTLPDRSTPKLSLLSAIVSSVDLTVTSLLGIRGCWSRDCLPGTPLESQVVAGYQIIRATLWFGLSFVPHERSIMVNLRILVKWRGGNSI